VVPESSAFLYHWLSYVLSSESEAYLKLIQKIMNKKIYFLKLSNATMTDSAPTMICIQGVPPVIPLSQASSFGTRWTSPPINNSHGAHFCMSFVIFGVPPELV